MNRTVAIVLTIITSLFCGLPGIAACLFGAQIALGSTNPDFIAGFVEGSNGMSPDIILPIGLGVMGFALLLIAIPVLVGYITFRMSKSEDIPTN